MRIKSKLIALSLLFVLSIGTSSATVVSTLPPTEKVTDLTEAQKARIAELKARVYEIKNMDRSKLTKADRKALRQELRDMNKEAKGIQGKGVYLSLGAIIIIILLLILIL